MSVMSYSLSLVCLIFMRCPSLASVVAVIVVLHSDRYSVCNVNLCVVSLLCHDYRYMFVYKGDWRGPFKNRPWPKTVIL